MLPSWFQSYLGLEAAAALIRTYEVQFVPGLLQTAEYARAVILLGHGRARPRRSSAGSSLRMAPAAAARPGANPPQLWAVIDEAVLRRPIGGAEGDAGAARGAHRGHRAAQRHGCRSSRSRPAAHAAAGGAFTILRFPDQDLPDVVYVEQLTSALYLDKRDDVDHYATAMERLCSRRIRRAHRGHPAADAQATRAAGSRSPGRSAAVRLRQGLTAIAPYIGRARRRSPALAARPSPRSTDTTPGIDQLQPPEKPPQLGQVAGLLRDAPVRCTPPPPG